MIAIWFLLWVLSLSNNAKKYLESNICARVHTSEYRWRHESYGMTHMIWLHLGTINSSQFYWVLLIIMWPVWARLIVAPPTRGHLEVTLSVFLDSGGSWSFFVQEIYIKSNVCLSRNTYVFEPSFSDIYFTGWFDFSFIFSVFSGLTAFISGI